jgi:hypothetical protein
MADGIKSQRRPTLYNWKRNWPLPQQPRSPLSQQLNSHLRQQPLPQQSSSQQSLCSACVRQLLSNPLPQHPISPFRQQSLPHQPSSTLSQQAPPSRHLPRQPSSRNHLEPRSPLPQQPLSPVFLLWTLWWLRILCNITTPALNHSNMA